MKQEIRERIEKIRKGEVPEGYKKTIIGIVVKEWDLIEFRTVFEEVSKLTSDIQKYPLNSLTIQTGVEAKTQRYERSFLITKEGDNYKIVSKDQFVFNPMNLRFGAIGRYKGEKEVCVSGYYNIFRCINGNNSAYMEYLLKDYRMIQLYNKYAIGSLIEKQRLHYSHFIQFKIPLPQVKEQEKIALILSTCEKAIDLKEKLITEKKEFKKGLIQKLLTGKIRFPGFTGEWTEIPLKNIVERITSKNEENNKTVLTISSKEGFVNQDEYFNKLVASKDLSEYFLLKKGDFVYNKSYSNGYPVGAIKRLDSFENAVVTTLYICFRIKDKKVSSNFLKYYFDAGLLNNQINRIANEGGRAHGLLNVTPKDFFNVKVNLPEYEEQEKISEILLTNEQDIKFSEKYLFELKEQKRGLMQLLLTGIIRVGVD